MKLDSYWTDSAPAFVPQRARPAGAGATWRSSAAASPGLSAALALARRGASGGRCSRPASAWRPRPPGRNGGHVNNGLAVDYAEVAAKVGVERARAWYHAYDAAVDTVERIVRDEAIDCDFVRRGKLKLATRPAHLEALRRSAERLVRRRRRHRRARSSTRRACAPRWRASASSAACSTSAAARCTWAASRTAWRRRPSAAARRSTPAPACSGSSASAAGQAHRVHTARGTRARAAGAAGHRRDAARRLRQLRLAAPAHRADRQLHRRHRAAGRRARAGAAARAPHLRDGRQHPPLLPPHARPPAGVRRARALRGVAARSRTRRAARSCAPAWSRRFRSCATCGIDYCWGGLVDMTQDRLPHAGERDGLFYSTGYSGHGTQMSVLMGERMAAVMAGDASANPWRGRDWPRDSRATSGRRGSCRRSACTTGSRTASPERRLHSSTTRQRQERAP